MKIIAISGGEIGRPKENKGRYPIETRKIDKEIIYLSGKASPNALLIPTASGDSKSYYEVFDRYYGKMLGCNTDVLYLINNRPSKNEIEKKIADADIIYVGGGNTLKMLKLWRKLGVDKLFEQAGNDGKILSGLSAGAICWFKYGNSDSMKFSNSDNDLIKLKGLDLKPIMLCPHYDVEKDRKPSLFKMIEKSGRKCIALENCSAIEIIDDRYRILTSNKKANAYLISRKNKKVIEETLDKGLNFRSLDEITY